MDKVTIQIDSKWQRIVRSPVYYLIAALQGVAVTFVPFALYWCGKGRFGKEAVVVPIYFAIILFVSIFYFRLGAAVVKELLKK